jgi:hypothetical protein
MNAMGRSKGSANAVMHQKESTVKFSESRVGRGVGMAAALVVTAFVLFLYLVFGAAGAGNAGAWDSFKSTVIPISLGLFVVYSAVAIYLFSTKRERLSMYVAWAPCALAFVAPVLFQVASAIVGSFGYR